MIRATVAATKMAEYTGHGINRYRMANICTRQLQRMQDADARRVQCAGRSAVDNVLCYSSVCSRKPTELSVPYFFDRLFGRKYFESCLKLFDIEYSSLNNLKVDITVNFEGFTSDRSDMYSFYFLLELLVEL